jgi:hypothetical protein
VAEALAAILGRPPPGFSGSALPWARAEESQAEWAGAPASGQASMIPRPARLVQQVALVQLGHQVDQAGRPKAMSLHRVFSSSDLSVRLVVEARSAIRAGDAPNEREADEPHHHCQQLHHATLLFRNCLDATCRLLSRCYDRGGNLSTVMLWLRTS